jgi:uracil-DNA glycosylase
VTSSRTTAARRWREVRDEACSCRNCDLWKDTTQTVFGEGPVPSPMMLIGEQPGDHEDREGRCFVGPAGRVLDDALARAGLDRGALYLTNAVKHFKHEMRGKRRIHAKPGTTEIVACRPWLDLELELVAPEVVVAMGAVAVRSLLGPSAGSITKLRGRVLTTTHGFDAVVTAHPSSALRVREPAEREPAIAAIAADLEVAKAHLARRHA